MVLTFPDFCHDGVFTFAFFFSISLELRVCLIQERKSLGLRVLLRGVKLALVFCYKIV